jgi:hypothetical protein
VATSAEAAAMPRKPMPKSYGDGNGCPNRLAINRANM